MIAKTHRFSSMLPFALLAFLLVPLSLPALALNVGDKAPAFELPGPQGMVRLTEPHAKLIYLDYWASWCGPCRQSFPWMNDLQTRYGPQGLRIIAVNLDAKSEDAQRFLARYPANFTLAFDPKGETPRQYGVKGMPTSYILAPDGTVLAKHMGFREADQARLEEQIASALRQVMGSAR